MFMSQFFGIDQLHDVQFLGFLYLEYIDQIGKARH